MKYDIYFHNDLDGMASAAILFNFLKNRGDKVLSFYPVDFLISKKRWAKLKFKNPFAVIDFLYHPRATIWFDHHPTTFIKDSWKKNFRHKKLFYRRVTYSGRNARYIKWNTHYKSCSKLIIDCLRKDFRFRSPRFLKELAEHTNKIDGYLFRSAKESIDFRNPALKLDLLLNSFKLSNKIIAKIITTLATKPLKYASRLAELRPYFKKFDKEIKLSKKFYKTKVKILENTAFTDETQSKSISIKSLLYYFYPKIPYFVILEKDSDTKFCYSQRYIKTPFCYKLTAGKNPWLKFENKVSIGQFLRKHYGGGGHDYVGGAEFKTKSSALKAVKDIAQFLNYQYHKNNGKK